MTPTLQAVIGICVGLLTVLKAATMLGWRAGAEEHTVATLAADVLMLRAWRHKIGDDPSHQISQIVEIQYRELDRRITKLETKVFNGAKP